MLTSLYFAKSRMKTLSSPVDTASGLVDDYPKLSLSTRKIPTGPLSRVGSGSPGFRPERPTSHRIVGEQSG